MHHVVVSQCRNLWENTEMSLVESQYLAANMGRTWAGLAPISLCKSVTAY